MVNAYVVVHMNAQAVSRPIWKLFFSISHSLSSHLKNNTTTIKEWLLARWPNSLTRALYMYLSLSPSIWSLFLLFLPFTQSLFLPLFLLRALSLPLYLPLAVFLSVLRTVLSLCPSLSLCGMFAYVDMCVRIQQNTEQFFNQVCIVNIARKRCSFTRPEREFDESVCAVEFGTLMRYSGKIQKFVFVFCFPIKLVH